MSPRPITTCAGCGAPIGQFHGRVPCAGYRLRAELRDDGWVPVRALAGERRASQSRIAGLWPEQMRAPEMTLVVGGFGVRGEGVVDSMWIRADERTATRVVLAQLLVLRDRTRRTAAIEHALAMPKAGLDAALTVEGMSIRVSSCGDHRLVFRHGGLTSFDHEHPAAGTGCRALLDAWRRGSRPTATFDVVRGRPPAYVVRHDPAPKLSGLRAAIAVVVRHRLLAEHGRALPWLPDRLRVEIGPPGCEVRSAWAGIVPLLDVEVPPSWAARPRPFAIPPPADGSIRT